MKKDVCLRLLLITLKRRKFQAKHSVGDGGERLPIVYIHGTSVPLRHVGVRLVLYIYALRRRLCSFVHSLVLLVFLGPQRAREGRSDGDSTPFFLS